MAKICDFEVYQGKLFTWLKNEGRKKCDCDSLSIKKHFLLN